MSRKSESIQEGIKWNTRLNFFRLFQIFRKTPLKLTKILSGNKCEKRSLKIWKNSNTDSR